jgi:predicted nucleic acid-binding protein
VTAPRTFVDTNILVYLFDARDPAKQERARVTIDRLGTFVISSQVLGELYVTVIRKLSPPMDLDTAAQVVRDLGRQTVVGVDGSMVWSAIDTSRGAQISYWDALIVEAAARGACDRVLTEDLAAGAVIRGVEIVNPFA